MSNDAVRKVFERYRLTDNPELDALLIDRVLKIIAREFDVTPKYEFETPIAVTTALAPKAEAPSKPASTNKPPQSASTNQNHYQQVFQNRGKVPNPNAPRTPAPVPTTPPPDVEEVDEVTENENDNGSDGVDSIGDDDAKAAKVTEQMLRQIASQEGKGDVSAAVARIPGTTPRKMGDSMNLRGSGKAISRAE